MKETPPSKRGSVVPKGTAVISRPSVKTLGYFHKPTGVHTDPLLWMSDVCLNFSLDARTRIYNHLVVYKSLDLTFAALSDPTRRSIVDRLTRGPATVNELAAPFAMSQQAVSKHIAYLEMAHLIERQWQGRQNFCALKPEGIREVAKWAEGFRSCWEKNFQRLDVLLAEMKKKPSASPKVTRRGGKSRG